MAELLHDPDPMAAEVATLTEDVAARARSIRRMATVRDAAFISCMNDILPRFITMNSGTDTPTPGLFDPQLGPVLGSTSSARRYDHFLIDAHGPDSYAAELREAWGCLQAATSGHLCDADARKMEREVKVAPGSQKELTVFLDDLSRLRNEVCALPITCRERILFNQLDAASGMWTVAIPTALTVMTPHELRGARDAAWHNMEPGQKSPLRDILDMLEYTGMVFGTVGEVSKGVRRKVRGIACLAADRGFDGTMAGSVPTTRKGNASNARRNPRLRKGLRKCPVPKEKLDEEIHAQLQQVLDSVKPCDGLSRGSGSAGCTQLDIRVSKDLAEGQDKNGDKMTSSFSPSRYGGASGVNSGTSSVDKERMQTSFTHLPIEGYKDGENLATPPMHSSLGPDRTRSQTVQQPLRNQAVLCQSIANLQVLVNAKIHNLMMEKRQLETRIPTPPSAVRPVPTSNLRGGEVARQPEAGRLSPAESQDFFSTPPHSNTDSPLRLQRTYSGASGGSCDIRDSTEVGLGQLREAAVADSLMDTAGISAFIESEGMVAQDSEIACEYSEYSGDDFEEYEDEEVQEDADVMGTSPADISQRARALSSSLQQLQSFMALPKYLPQANHRGVIEDAFGTDGIGCEPSANQDILRRL
eukprot:jgi/Tetstr1/458258/TSEL_044746.t1